MVDADQDAGIDALRRQVSKGNFALASCNAAGC